MLYGLLLVGASDLDIGAICSLRALSLALLWLPIDELKVSLFVFLEMTAFFYCTIRAAVTYSVRLGTLLPFARLALSVESVGDICMGGDLLNLLESWLFRSGEDVNFCLGESGRERTFGGSLDSSLACCSLSKLFLICTLCVSLDF